VSLSLALACFGVFFASLISFNFGVGVVPSFVVSVNYLIFISRFSRRFFVSILIFLVVFLFFFCISLLISFANFLWLGRIVDKIDVRVKVW
jgi:hypothetical protein